MSALDLGSAANLAGPADPVIRIQAPPLHSAIIPEGYLLTTRLLYRRYYEPYQGCPPGVHTHSEHVVFWPLAGAAEIEVAGQPRPLEPGQGIWVPAFTPHRADRSEEVRLAAVHILPAAWREPGEDVRELPILPSVQELLLYLIPTPMPKQRRLRAQRVCLELLAEDTAKPLHLEIPRDERIAPIARAIRQDPADDTPLEDWAWKVSLSSRTFSRAFRSSAGMSFIEWRTQARCIKAIDLLNEGMPVGMVARKVGYSSIGAFSNAFHRVVGRRPNEFLPGSPEEYPEEQPGG